MYYQTYVTDEKLKFRKYKKKTNEQTKKTNNQDHTQS